MSTFFLHLVNGLSYSFLLFIISSGISLVFGILGVLNLAHGSLYILGSYITLSITMKAGLPFWVALLLIPIIVGILGILVEIVLLRPTYKLGHLSQVLLTFGLAYVLHDLIAMVWGKNIMTVAPPQFLSHSINFMGNTVPAYRLALIVVGIVIALVLWYGQEKTRWGAIIRAGLSDKEMAGGLGVNINVVFTLVFAFGSLLAGLGGVLGSPVFGVSPGLEFNILILSLVVLVVGGLGSVTGTVLASLLVGFVETLSRYYVPEVSLIITFALMAVVLIFRPQGLVGRRV